MEELEAEIQELAEAAKENITKAAAAQETAVKEHEEEAKAAVDENLAAYIEANKEGGEGMTKDELQNNIRGSLEGTPEVADAVSAMLEANEQIAEIDTCLGDLNKLIQDTQALEADIEVKKGDLDAQIKADEAAKCCDPIGFTTTDEEGNQAQYDFIVDDGAFDSTSDFLGAENQWEEMAALDTDGDNIVSSAELQAGNIKAVKTNADGSQEVVDLADEFGEDFSIDLASYQQGGSHSAVDTTTDHDGDGTADQQMLGTFNINANGQTISGYNTLDDTDWLAEQYGLTAETPAADADAAQALDPSMFSEDLQPHVNFFNLYTEESANLKEQLKGVGESVNLTEEAFASINAVAAKDASEEAGEETTEGEEQTLVDTETVADPASMTAEEEELLREEELMAA